jgi:histidinol-phosphate aminotransferase
VISALQSVRPPWNVNALAQAAGVAVLEDVAHLECSRVVVREAKGYLEREIARMGLKVFASAANFLLVRVGDAAGFRRSLLARGCCVRDCTSFGLPDCIRVGVKTVPECQRLIADMKEVLYETDLAPGLRR